MAIPPFLSDSLEQLRNLTRATYSENTAPIANAIWEKHLQDENPQWEFVSAQPFSIQSPPGSAHVMAMIDTRLPDMGLVGYFGCSDGKTGAEVLRQASQWLKEHHGVTGIYGPIHGTATSNYRLNLDDDYWFPGEPVNPRLHIDAFRQAGFSNFNRYATGVAKHYRLFTTLFIRPPKNAGDIHIRSFDAHNQLRDLEKFHRLMTTIFPEQSAYCPVLSWQERLYNFQDKDPLFNSRYTYFLQDGDKPIGLIVAYPYNQALVVKTVGLLKEYRNKNLASLLIRKVHQTAADDELQSAIYAMVRVGNTAYRMKRPGVKIVRQYVTMKKNI